MTYKTKRVRQHNKPQFEEVWEKEYYKESDM